MRETVRGPGWALAMALALALCPPSLPAAASPSAAASAAVPATAPAEPARKGRRGVLILTGSQYGIPVTDALVAEAAGALKRQGVGGAQLYVEHLDIARHRDPQWRAELAGVLRVKLVKADVGLVITTSQLALEFLAQEGHDFVAPGTPVVATLITNPNVVWRGTSLPVLNVTNRWDIRGTLRMGLELFPRTRRLFVVAGSDELQSQFHAQAAEALAALPGKVELETAAALSHDEMLQRVSTLPRDTLVLLGVYFNDRTGRSFLPAEVAAEVARRSSVPVMGCTTFVSGKA